MLEVLQEEELCEMSQCSFADNQEVSMQKHVELSELKKPKADMSAFDYEAFCRRQGISESPEPPNDDDDGGMIHMGV